MTSLAYEQAQDRARASNEEIERPPCPGCGQLVADEDWDDHRLQKHGIGGPRPYGKPDSREALFLADDLDELDRKIIRWRRQHPGVGLLPMGEGTDHEAAKVWVRFRLMDRRGRRAA